MVGSMVEKRNQQGAVLDMSVEIIQIIIHVSKKGKKKEETERRQKKSKMHNWTSRRKGEGLERRDIYKDSI